ncbi:MAG: putative Ig domain-containing protein [Limisphaerales bacterium]
MKSFISKMISGLLLFQASLFLCQSGWATGFTVTPSAVSNTYSGTTTLTMTGLTNTETVVVQKFLDLNANGTIDAGDLLVQQFNLTDGQAGMVIGGVTNFNVPGDTDGTADGQITATLNFPSFDFNQSAIGKYLFKLSSPVGHFSPITNSFNVTNFPFAQKITGNVVNNGAPVPDSGVILFPPPRSGNHGPGTPLAEVVANNSGAYAIQLPPGTYVPMAFGSNYVADYSASPVLTLSGSQIINTNLTLIVATAKISGTLVDANDNSIKLPGVFMPASDNSGVIGIGFSDTNGNFSIGVTSGTWGAGSSDQGLGVYGYVGFNNSTNVSAGATGLTLAYPKATALFYGTVKDDSGNPVPGIDVSASDQNNTFQSDGDSDADGNYVVGAVGGLSGDAWQAQVSGDSAPANYLFSQPALDQNGGTNLDTGAAVHQNFTALPATNHITGNVQFNGTNVVGVQVNVFATINGQDYQAQMDTDGNGNYSLNVANGDWSVSVNCGGGSDSLDNILGGGNYQCPNNQNVTNNNNNGTANFTVQSCNGVEINTTSLPDGTNGVYYDQWLSASSCSGNINWSINSGSLPPDMNFYPNGEINGTPSSAGTFNFTVHADDGNGHTADQPLSLHIIASGAPGLQITTTSLPNGASGVFYSQTLQASGGQTPYTWSLNGNSPFGLTLSSSGVLSGTPNYTGTNTFTVFVTDHGGTQVFTNLTLAVLGPLQINTFYLPNGTNTLFYSQQLQASGGTPPYGWYVPNYSASPPPNLSLSSGGVLSGTPAVPGNIPGYGTNFYFDVVVTDAVANVYEEDGLTLTIVNPPAPPLTITNVSLSNGTVGAVYSAQLGANGGNPPYTWQLAQGSASLPSGLSLHPSSGLISGVPTTNQTAYFQVQVTDANSTTVKRALSITVNSAALPPTISGPGYLSGGQFQMTVNGAAGQNYAVQMSTNLASTNWIPLLSTNPSGSSFLFDDTHATNRSRFYRVKEGP